MRRRTRNLALALSLVLLAAIPPLTLETSAYPISIVNGNSMVPTFNNGDIVVFAGLNQARIHNGSIIVFTPTGFGVGLLDSIVPPVVVHRVVSIIIQNDGTVLYRTKGDNNRLADPSLIGQGQVLGIVQASFPKVGLLLSFLKSPQGLVASVALLTLFYLSNHEAKIKKDKGKDEFLAAMVQRFLNGEISEKMLKKFELAVRYSTDLDAQNLNDGSTLALVDWLKRGGLEHNWTLRNVLCPNCSKDALSFESRKDLLLVVCPACSTASPTTLPQLGQEARNLVMVGSSNAVLQTRAVKIREDGSATLPISRLGNREDEANRRTEIEEIVRSRDSDRGASSENRKVPDPLADVPTSRWEVGDKLTVRNKPLVVEGKAFDFITNNWRYTLRPAEDEIHSQTGRISRHPHAPNVLESGQHHERRIPNAFFRLGDIVEFDGAWDRVVEIEKAQNGLFFYRLEDTLGWHEEWSLEGVKVPPSKKEVGETVIHQGKQYVVSKKRFDMFEKKWKYVLEPTEELKAHRILSIHLGAARYALSRIEDG